ncbi:MAG: hypothetical protein B0W54_05790 [Cellvibrio sp. 79]|nr:MAG: hypothetical protein B0W54_05790 [Cellvibrio sp. 79]
MQPNQSPLDQLADIHLPDSVSWWPLAPGWWAILALLILALVAVFLWRRHLKQNRYRKLAQQELDTIYSNYQNTQNATAFLHEISVLLRRTALTAYPKSFNASIKGQAWLEWLDRVYVNPAMQFNSAIGQQLLTASYQKNPQIEATALYHLCRNWLSQHRNYRQKLPARKPLKTAEASHV